MTGDDGLILLGGYALAAGLLFLGVWAHRRPWRQVAVGAFACAGLAASATTYFWLSKVWNPVVVGVLFAALPLLLGLWIWWRGFARDRWMDRLAARGRGTSFRGDSPGRPSFGVLPGSGRARRHDDGGAGFESAVELRTQGIGVLGVQYLHLQGASGEEPWRGTLSKLSDLDGTFSMVQVQTPTVPTLVIRARSGVERRESINPMDDAKYRRNTFGAVSPGVRTTPVDVDGEFGTWFEVHAADPQRAAAMLTPQVARTLLDDPWFRLGEIVLHDGVVWTTRWGRMTEHALFDTSRKLTQLAAVLPAESWPDRGFATVVREADTTPGGWGADTARSRRGRVSVLMPVNARRAAAGRTPLTVTSLLVRTLLAVGLLALGGFLASNPVAAWYPYESTGEGDSAAVDMVFHPLLGLGLLALAYWLLRTTFWPKKRSR